MPSPIASGWMEVLARESQLTEKDWLKLLESRYQLIKPHLDSFTLTELGDEEIISFDGSNLGYPITINAIRQRYDFRIFMNEGLDFHTQGIYGIQREANLTIIFGIARNGQWLVVYCKEHNRRMTEVIIQEVKLADLIRRVEKNLIWKSMGKAIKHLIERRKELYEKVSKLGEEIDMQDLILETVLHIMPLKNNS